MDSIGAPENKDIKMNSSITLFEVKLINSSCRDYVVEQTSPVAKITGIMSDNDWKEQETEVNFNFYRDNFVFSPNG